MVQLSTVESNTLVIPASGGATISSVSLGGEVPTELAADTSMKRLSFNPASWAIPGKTTVFTLRAVGRVANAALTGTVEVYDLTDSATVGHVDFDSATVAEKTTVLVFDNALHLYEARIRVAGGGGPGSGDYCTASAQLSVTWV